MANEFYNRGATFNPDELADGDAIEAEFDAVARGFDTIGTNVDANKAGYPTQTFHVAPATEATHAVQKDQMDSGLAPKLDAASYTSADVLDKLKTVDGSTSGLDADLLDGQEGSYYRNANNINKGTLAKERLPANIDANTSGNANTATNATDHINNQGAVHGATSGNAPGKLVIRDGNGDIGARTFVGDLLGVASSARVVSDTAPTGEGRDLVFGTMAKDDYFRLRIGSNAYDAGEVEIATSDNGNEPICVRQYTGEFANITRTLTLLNEYGLTKVPLGVDCTNGYGDPAPGAVGNGISGSNGDGCTSTVNNLRISSWWGVGFSPSVSGLPVPYMEYSHWFNTRNGNAGMRGALSQNSDARLKENIAVIPDALSKVQTLRGITYDRKDGGGRLTGVIAQEVQAVLPEAVTVADDEMKTLSVTYGNMVGLLIEALKELKSEVDALKAKLPA